MFTFQQPLLLFWNVQESVNSGYNLMCDEFL